MPVKFPAQNARASLKHIERFNVQNQNPVISRAKRAGLIEADRQGRKGWLQPEFPAQNARASLKRMRPPTGISRLA